MGDSKNTCYALVQWHQNDKLYLPVIDGRLIRSGLAVHKSSSIKGKIFHQILISKPCLGVLNKLSLVKYEEPERFGGYRWNEWKNHALQAIGIDSGWAAFSFPNNEERRFVALLIDNNGQVIGFAKVALDEEIKKLFKNEVNGLRYFLKHKPNEFSVPEIKFEGEFEKGYYFIQTVIPPQAKYFSNINNMKWIRIVDEIVTNSITHKSLRSQSWWKKFHTLKKPTSMLLPFIESKASDNIQVCMAHGDFSPGNILYYKGDFWVYDWEGFSQNAPVMTDYLIYTIEHFIKLPFLSRSVIAKKIINYLFDNIEYTDNYNIALALVFMSISRNWTVNDRLATALCEELLKRKWLVRAGLRTSNKKFF